MRAVTTDCPRSRAACWAGPLDPALGTTTTAHVAPQRLRPLSRLHLGSSASLRSALAPNMIEMNSSEATRVGSDPRNRVVVAQLGARMHYAVARILHSEGLLERLYTDTCATKGWPRLLHAIPPPLRPAPLKRLLERVPHGVPRSLIRAFTAFGVSYARRVDLSSHAFVRAGKTFCEMVIGGGFGRATCVYAYNSAALEILRAAKKAGIRTVLEQTIAPLRYEVELLNVERKLHPDWEQGSESERGASEFAEREEEEWAEADKILCGSNFVAHAMSVCGGPLGRCAVVPYGFDPVAPCPVRPAHGGPLRVLTVGAIGLRKGSPYVIDAARQLKGVAEFRMVGGHRLSGALLAHVKQCVDLTGHLSRSQLASQYAWADIFLLPSLCEGSATATYEALAAGLPVICTPNTGSVVRNGREGVIVPIRSSRAIVQAIESLAASRRGIADQAAARAGEFTLAAYGRRLLGALELAG